MYAVILATLCQCPPSTLPPRNLPQSTLREDHYATYYQRALRERRNLAVWVGYTCAPCEVELSDAIHYRAQSPWRGVEGPAVLTYRLDTGSSTYDGSVVTGDLSVSAIRRGFGVRQLPLFSFPMRTVMSPFRGSVCGPNGCQ